MEAFWKRIAEVLFLSKLEKRWRKIAKALAVFVVFWTTYMLILPAITIENDTYCGLDEHSHNENCYIIEANLICGYEYFPNNEIETLTSYPEEVSTENSLAEGTTEESTTAEKSIAEESSLSGSLIVDSTTEPTETSEIVHTHTSECYENQKSIICTLEEHSHEDICFIEGISFDNEMFNVNLLADDDYAVSPLADAANPVTRINFDELDGSGSTYYVVFTVLNNNYYAIDGNGKAVAITVNSAGTVTSNSMGNNLYWTFSLQSGSTYTIRNVGTSRYMHSYNNSSTDYGVTTSGNYTSNLETTGNGNNKTFAVKSNSNYSRIVASGNSAVFQTTTNVNSAARFYLAEVYIPKNTYHVWFDGTCGGLMSLYESPDTYRAVSADNNTIILPTEWQSPSKYSYTLNGWYDIKNHKYYKPGETVTISKDTVFYADWVATTYDVGIVDDTNINYIAPSLDTNSFIRTDMFDYSAVFNMQAVTHTGSVSATSHSETWSVVRNNTVPYNSTDSLEFIFRDWDSGGSDISYPANLIRLNNNQGTQITSGIIDYVSDVSEKNIVDMLFNPATEVIGKNYVGQANYLYQFMETGSENYDGIHNGYYYYDATLNAASYNQSAQRFYIYNYLERTSDSLKDSFDSNGNPTAAGAYSDFLPFNSPYKNNHNNKTITSYTDSKGNTGNYQYDAKATNQGSAAANAGTNYWFGMKSEIKFYLPDDTGTVDAYKNYGNISSHGQHMTFEFSGDDDLWVFIDGELVMDIGGLHGIMNGKIDFSTGVITTSTANDVLETGTASPVEKTFLPPLKAGDHTLTIYYMERGGSQSNCAIYFNITPRYGIELVKQDAISGKDLSGAVFGVYTDIDCTKPAELWTSEAAYKNNEAPTNTFSSVNGKIPFWGISAGKVYYVKELQAPPGYPVTDDIIRISMNNLGNSICTADTLRGKDGMHTDGFEIIQSTANEAFQQIAMKIANQADAAAKRNVAVYKDWKVDDESLIPESVTVYLRANGLNTGRSAILSEINDWSYVWIDLPIYDSNGNTIEYSVYEEQAEGFYADVEVSDGLMYINAWVQTDAFYDGGTFLIVDRASATENSKGKALSVNRSGNFEWVDFETAKNDPSTHWVVNADGMGFHVINKEGYHIILNETTRFVPQKNGNRILYYDRFNLAARYNNEYYYLNNNFSASKNDQLKLELYINMDILVHEEEGKDDEVFEDGELNNDGEIIVTVYNVTNIPIDDEKSTSFSVKKEWEDGAANHINDNITLKLYANGTDTGRTLTLNHSNNWYGTFEGLLYEDDSGNLIRYTVEESAFDGYHPEYSAITVIEGGTRQEEITVEDWVVTSTLTAGKTYRFINGDVALTANSNNTNLSVAKASPTDKYQQWIYTSNNTLQNVGKSGYYLYMTGSSTNRTVRLDTNSSTVSLRTNGLRITSGNTNRYITFTSSGVSLTQNSGTVPTTYIWDTTTKYITVAYYPSYSITVTNIKVYYLLPETGGTGTYYLYIIGGLLSTLSAVFLLCLYKKDRGRRRSGFW